MSTKPAAAQFDAFVGNPPFLGGQRITGIAGTVYRNWLVERVAEGRRGSADLVAYFFLRVYSLLRNEGGFGLLAVNTIAEGDTRQVGLEAMVRGRAVIHVAYPNEPWPGKAAVVTSRVHIHKGEWRGDRSLLGQPVPFISAFLSNHEEWSPKRLKANEGIAYQGSIVLGLGFLLTPDEARRMLDADPKNADVIFPYLNGEDLNSDPGQRPSRWAINFWDWPEEKAKTYSLPYAHLEENVKAERLINNDRGAREKWWLFLRARSELYHAIGRGNFFHRHPEGWKQEAHTPTSVLAIPETTKYCLFSLVDNSIVFSHMLKVISNDSHELLCIFNSSIHEAWARKQSSTLETRLKYITTTAFETFPFPGCGNAKSTDLGSYLTNSRAEICLADGIGFTKLYNLVHSPRETDSRIQYIRNIHRDIDKYVTDAYGWEDINLGHDFHDVPYLPENDRIRFTISEAARIEVLRRLSELNRQRYKQEVDAGLHKATKKPASGKNRAKQGAGDLFSADNAEMETADD